MNIKRIKFLPHGDSRGQLIALEQNKDIPFHIKRVYYLYDTKDNVVRGKHAHKKLKQVLLCIKGSCKIKLDDGKTFEEIFLNNPNEGIFINNTVWREMYDFSSDAVLLVLASELYDENDYIRDYDDFIKYINKK